MLITGIRFDSYIAEAGGRDHGNASFILVREFTRLCEEDDLLKLQDKEAPYVAFFDRFNTLLGKANEVNPDIA